MPPLSAIYTQTAKSSSVYKIVITERKGQIVKKKFYESETMFRRWLQKHKRNYDYVYNVKGYKRVKDTWKEVQK